MERKGIFRRMTPVSNAFVVYGNCLCHSDEDTIEEEHHTTDGQYCRMSKMTVVDTLPTTLAKLNSKLVPITIILLLTP